MGLIVLRVGVPVVLLALLGLLIDRWQTKRNEEIRRQYMFVSETADERDLAEQSDTISRAA
jgi:hypothetical protein